MWMYAAVSESDVLPDNRRGRAQGFLKPHYRSDAGDASTYATPRHTLPRHVSTNSASNNENSRAMRATPVHSKQRDTGDTTGGTGGSQVAPPHNDNTKDGPQPPTSNSPNHARNADRRAKPFGCIPLQCTCHGDDGNAETRRDQLPADLVTVHLPHLNVHNNQVERLRCRRRCRTGTKPPHCARIRRTVSR